MSAFGQERTFDCPTVRGRYRYDASVELPARAPFSAASNSPAVAKRRVGSLASALITTASRAGVLFVMALTFIFSSPAFRPEAIALAFHSSGLPIITLGFRHSCSPYIPPSPPTLDRLRPPKDT